MVLFGGAAWVGIRQLDYTEFASAGRMLFGGKFRRIIDVGRSNIPVVDYHVHLKGGMTLEQALARSRRDGINYGIAVNCGRGNPVGRDERTAEPRR